MLIIILTLLFTTMTSAKLYNTLKSDPQPTPNVESNVWVLHINDDSLNFERLILANSEERKIFQKIIQPTIKEFEKDKKDNNYFSENKSKLNTDDAHRNKKENESNLRSTINKMFMTHLEDLDSQLSDNSNHEKSLKIYFFGPYSSLILTVDSNTYHYFINQPSPLPNWFYKAHTNIVNYKDTMSVEIPKDLKLDFLTSFLKLLRIFLSFPM